MRYEMSAYVAACALQKPKPANFSTIIQVSSRCWLVSPIIPAAFRNFPRNRSRSLRPENFADARRTRSASASDMLPSVCEICITCSWKMHTPSVSPRIFWSSGCANVISSSFRSRFTNNSFDPYSAAPGRISANACAISSSVRAFIVRKRPRMAGDSIWKTPMVRPAAITSHVAGSFSGIASKSISRAVGQTFLSVRFLGCGSRTARQAGMPVLLFSMLSSASDIVVNPRWPSRSILIRPSASMAFMSYCVTTIPFVARSSGVNLVNGRAEITVPQG